jgi:ribose transport system substrate-binding protein
MKKSLTVLVGLLISISLLLTGCGGSQGSQQADSKKASDKIKIGVVVKALNSDYWKLVEAGAKQAGDKLGIDVTVVGPNSETDVTGQIAMIEDQITKKVNALVIATSQPASAIPVLNKAKDAKIPVVLVDTDIPWDSKVSYVGTESFLGGKDAGNYLGKKLSKGSKVVILGGNVGDPNMDTRVNGCKEALKENGLEVATVQPANSERGMAVNVMENLIQSKQEFQAVFAANDEMALGAIRALEAAKINVPVVGFDASPDALRAIKDGKLDASVAQDAIKMGYISVESAMKAAKGEAVDKRINTGTKIIDKDNVDQKVEELSKALGKNIIQ